MHCLLRYNVTTPAMTLQANESRYTGNDSHNVWILFYYPNSVTIKWVTCTCKLSSESVPLLLQQWLISRPQKHLLPPCYCEHALYWTHMEKQNILLAFLLMLLLLPLLVHWISYSILFWLNYVIQCSVAYSHASFQTSCVLSIPLFEKQEGGY